MNKISTEGTSARHGAGAVNFYGTGPCKCGQPLRMLREMGYGRDRIKWYDIIFLYLHVDCPSLRNIRVALRRYQFIYMSIQPL